MPDWPVMVTEPPPWDIVNTPAESMHVEFAKISCEVVPGMWHVPPAFIIGTGALLEYSWASPVLANWRPVPAVNVWRFESVCVSTAALLVTIPIPTDATKDGRIGVTNATVDPIVVPEQFWKERIVGV